MRAKRASVFLYVIIFLAIIFVGYRIEKKLDVAVSPLLAVPIISPVANATFSAQASSAATPPAVEVVESINEDFADRFAVVASAYAEEVNYPPYSTPLTAADTQLLQPNLYHAQVVPLENGASASIQLDKFRFNYPEIVEVRLLLEGIQVYEVSLRLLSELSGKILTTSRMQTEINGYKATLTPESEWDEPLRIEIEFKSGGHSQIVQTGFEYSQPVAKIIGLGSTYSDATDLIIPVKLNVTLPGFYRLRANLFNAERRPLAVLSESARLTKGDTELKLRVYKSLLKNTTAPLWLSTFQLENRSAAPGEPTRYGDSDQAEFKVDYAGGSLFSEANYNPSDEEKQRLEFLKSMAEKK